MKTKRMFMTLVIMLILSGSFTSCTEDFDGVKAILGKWNKHNNQ